MGRRKKLMALLVLLALCRDSRQEDYEEEVFLNKCQLDTTKIYDSIHTCSDVKQALAKVKADVAEQGKEIKATLAEMRAWIVTMKTDSEAVAKFVSDYNKCKESIPAARYAELKLVKLSTGRYFYQQEWLIHSAARAWCEERGMRLAQFETLQEMKVVLENATNDYDYWLGASDVGFAHGDFRWSGGAKVETEFWWEGPPKQPNDNGTGKETCVYTRQSYKKLADWSCTSSRRPLCEVPPEFSGCL